MAAKTTISLEEFLKLPEAEDDGTHYELDEGELITLSPGGTNHSILIASITMYLGQILDRSKYVVLSGEAGVILSDEPGKATVRGADDRLGRAWLQADRPAAEAWLAKVNLPDDRKQRLLKQP